MQTKGKSNNLHITLVNYGGQYTPQKILNDVNFIAEKVRVKIFLGGSFWVVFVFNSLLFSVCFFFCAAFFYCKDGKYVVFFFIFLFIICLFVWLIHFFFLFTTLFFYIFNKNLIFHVKKRNIRFLPLIVLP